jgi:hypothetical protein
VSSTHARAWPRSPPTQTTGTRGVRIDRTNRFETSAHNRRSDAASAVAAGLNSPGVEAVADWTTDAKSLHIDFAPATRPSGQDGSSQFDRGRSFIHDFGGLSLSQQPSLYCAEGKPVTFMPFSTKRWAYSDTPKLSSQSAICCIARRAELPRQSEWIAYQYPPIYCSSLRNVRSGSKGDIAKV